MLGRCGRTRRHALVFASVGAWIAGISLATASCAVPTGSSSYVVSPNAEGTKLTGERVVLVTVDGVRWQDVFQGSNLAFGGLAHHSPDDLLPRTLTEVRKRGVAWGYDRPGCGTAHPAGRSNVSLPGYLEIFTAHAPPCMNNECEPTKRTLLDVAMKAGMPGVASISSWPMIARAVTGGDAHVFVSAGQSWDGPTDDPTLAQAVFRGQNVDSAPGGDGYRPDAHTGEIALAYFRRYRPAFLHVGFGDPDEWGHRNDYTAYLSSVRRIDDWIGTLADELDRMGEDGRRTTVLITPDHGRNGDFVNHGPDHPESARTFLLAFGDTLEGASSTCSARDVRLTDIAPSLAVRLGLPRDTSLGAGVPIDALVVPARRPTELSSPSVRFGGEPSRM